MLFRSDGSARPWWVHGFVARFSCPTSGAACFVPGGAGAGVSPTWRYEDGGARRRSACEGARLALQQGETLQATSRSAMVATMVVVAGNDEVFLLCHTGGDDAVSWVERIDPISLEVLASSEKLPGGPAWPGRSEEHTSELQSH